jgi:hypothetical protein
LLSPVALAPSGQLRPAILDRKEQLPSLWTGFMNDRFVYLQNPNLQIL